MDLLAGRFPSNVIEIEKAKGAWLFDSNSNRYVDYLLGNCCQILGHSHPRIVEAIHRQSELAINVGDQPTSLAYELAEKITSIANKDAVRFVSSGSEAVHLAIRLARSYTKRKKIIKFDGHYHGWFAEEISKFVPEKSYTSALPFENPFFISVPWNNEVALKDVLEKYPGEIAAIICEPVLCHAGTIPPVNGFLKKLRDSADSIGALLIFDECITGLRLAMGGAQEVYSINADIVTYSKAFSAGLPLGICAGVEKVMKVLEDGFSYQAATYDANPLSLSVSLEVLSVIEEEGWYQKSETFGKKLISSLEEVFFKHSIPNVQQGFPCLFQFFFTEQDSVKDHHQALAETDIAFYQKLVHQLLPLGVNLAIGDIKNDPDNSWLSQWFLSLSHGDEEIDWTIKSVDKAIYEIRK